MHDDARKIDEFKEFTTKDCNISLPELHEMWERSCWYALNFYCHASQDYHPYMTVARLSYMRALVSQYPK